MSRLAQRLLFVAALAGLVFALGYFAKLRFQSGDLYPAYSTLRTDPLGTKALFESLERIKGAEVRRNLEPLERARNGAGITTVFLGLQSLEQGEENAIKLAREGSRVVLAVDARDWKTGKPILVKTIPAPPIGPGGTNTNVVVFATTHELGLNLGALDLPDTNRIDAVRVKDNIAAPESMYWFGNIRLIPIANTNEWETIYTAKDRPVVMERKFGLGSVLVVADSFPFSNEGLHLDRQPEFLLWILGSGKVIFDETHLGITRGSGIAVMMREFRLHGLAAGCLLLVGLWVWRNSAPLVPPAAPADAATETIEGKTAREAIVHLLRRNLTDIDLLRSGLDEYAKTHPSNEYWQTVRLNEARKLVDAYAAKPKPRDVAALQREISNILFPKRK